MLVVDSTSRLPNCSVVKPLSERRIFCGEKQGNVHLNAILYRNTSTYYQAVDTDQAAFNTKCTERK